MTTLEIILTVGLYTTIGLCLALVYTLKETVKVMKMASENSDMFYKEWLELRNTIATTAVTNINVSELVLSDDVKKVRAEALKQAREACE